MLRELVKNKKLRARVLERAEEFKLNNRAEENVWFRELILCILTSNSSFISAYKALNYIMDEIFSLSEDQMSKRLRLAGYRFYNLKAKYIANARKLYGNLKTKIKPIADYSQEEARQYIINNIDGLGLKESSHFLRNVGYFDLAIIDRHVLHFLNEIGTSNLKIKNKKDYYLAESILKSISINLGIQVGLLDLYIFFKQTNTIVK
ncbi:N-glycosylase/DNA lyase [Sulfurisphaera tokodaii]|uniref:8-oxoguanine DNA glycosylase/AP lyase n=2 Tax=Sulfurisphaera tokodaii TaxID=111955 RepID=OGG1_SULTO|nr:N-glycosylase/DNA lyase [Sulfurisphaera tokodaii]Q972A8.1 RecName: Full=8-oxoguanine DNA glycosylase/AP lyase; Includes: RecName: Full=8-oxoguanine DNA glycosylase; Short=8-oxoG DNA glycosylase; Includes: RecName: Full=DNA-(apurinic or apyrimidinic site) lyase; Short=AP lyase [Sulfurisphaera tokodaii str. 7]BAB66261.1 probable 8-oxoguanine DNA glycosylase/DNA lyase [Sulfurisphaera tokodaii str. 7]HII73241.1 N-glycosylase/DNA lyase [Sulfurisphaera tokodaii]